MKKSTLEILSCPRCQSARLELRADKTEAGEITEGNLTCQCGALYPIRNAIPRFIPEFAIEKTSSLRQTDLHTKKRFEYQWKVWGKDPVIFGKNEEDCLQCFEKFSGKKVNAKYLDGKRVLDAGCGHGRFTELFGRFGADVIGLDLGVGVEIAKWRTSGCKNIDIIQADVLNLPFKNGAFDYIWSNGVIHHTPDTRQAFKSLSERLKSEGYLDVWVYPKGGLFWEVSQRAIRIVTTRLPCRALHMLCFLAVPLLVFVRTYSGTQFPKNTWRQCAQVIYDWYSPRFQSHHTVEEVAEWYREEGFSDAEVLGVPVALSGRKG